MGPDWITSSNHPNKLGKMLILTDFVVLTIWHKRSLTPSRKVRQEKQKLGVLGDLA
jgi:hypothetical protein